MVDYTFGTIDSGVAEASPYVVGARSTSAPDMGANVGIDDLFSVGKGLFKSFAPQAYADATSFIPSWSDIGSGLEGLFGGGGDAAMSFMDLPAFGGGEVAGGAGSALGGAAAAFGPAAAFLAWAKIMKAINQNVDGPITLGSGYTSLEDGFYGGQGQRVDVAQGLSDQFRGDGSWYEGGDPSRVEPLDTAFGSMSWKKNIPAFTVGGAAYRTPDLAVSSGRQIARGMMGLPVEYEALPRGFGPIHDPMLSDVQTNQSLPVWDAPQQMPTDWDVWQDRAQNSSWSGQSNTEANAWAPETIDAYVGQQTPRGQDFFRTGLTYNDLYAYTGENSPDWSAEVADLSEVPGEMERFRSRPSLANYQFGVLG